MDDGHQGLDAVLMTFVKHVLIKLQAGLVGLLIEAVGVNTAPGNAQAVALKAHLREQGDVLLVVMVKINGLMAGILISLLALQHSSGAVHHRPALRAGGDQVHIGQTSAVHVVSALALIGGRRAAPQKVFRKTSHMKPPVNIKFKGCRLPEPASCFHHVCPGAAAPAFFSVL